LNKNYVIVDASQLTPEGYKGLNVSTVLSRLYGVCGKNLDKMKGSVVIVDEFDKLDKSDLAYEKSLRSSFLKMLEGEIVLFPPGVGDTNSGNWPSIDTRHIQFIFCGVFEHFTKIYNSEYKGVGFTKEMIKKDNNGIKDILHKIGLGMELIGRLDELIIFNNYTDAAYKDILVKSKFSPLNLTKALLRDLNYEVEFSEQFIDEAIEYIKNNETGMRSANKYIYDKTKHLYGAKNLELTSVVL
jgi:ATP-dependent protease Clp ATPase subunit